MEPGIVGIALLIVVFVTLGSGAWIFVGLLVAAIFCFAVLLGFPITRVGSISKSIILRSILSPELAAVPLFIWMGEIINRTDLSARLFRGLAPWVNSLPGGLLHINVGGSVLFSALSGSSVATTATVGRVTTRELHSRNYDRSLSLGSITVAGTIGIMIPPSITLIVYGLIAEVSVARLFAAGILPGLLLALLYSGYIAARCSLNAQLAPRSVEAYSWSERFAALGDLGPAVVLVALILGSIYAGVATPSEAAAVGVLGAIIIAHFMGGVSLRALYESAMSAVRLTAMIGSAFAAAALLSSAIAFLHLPQAFAQTIAAMELSPLILLLVLTIIYILLGCVLDGISMILMTVPITLPLMVVAGFDPIWFGIYIVLIVEMGLVTPPIGFNLFVLRGITGDSIGRIATATFPFFLLMLLAAALLVLFPAIVLWLPSLM